jgi:hypothetical protein
VDTPKDTASPAYPSTKEPLRNDQDERPHACIDGWVFITFEDEHGEEREASYRCRRCAESR